MGRSLHSVPCKFTMELWYGPVGRKESREKSDWLNL